MKTILIALLLLFILACKEKPLDPRIDPADTIASAQPLQKTKDSWLGTYSGTLPCWADCDGLKTEITVNADSTYTLSSHALGLEDKPSIYKGTYNLKSSTQVITLDAEGDHLKFLIQDNSLKKLDKFGDPEQGAPQERYILNKVK